MCSWRRPSEEALDAAVEYYLALEGPWKAWVEDQLENFEPGEILTRDEDVLDTWFSSALWPFSTLGWPDETPELKTYYQTDVLVTGFDIIFFWVARMMMMGLHFMDEEPFHTVYVHALVRDKNGAKMSKSKGNVIDPLDLIDEYGADALRFTLTIMAAQGRDVKLDPARIAGYRNFGTKLWNATRFAEMNGVARNDEFWLNDAKLTVNRWILTELTRASREITDGITSYKFNEAAAAAYRFVWNFVCDWYVELLKPVFMGADEAAKAESRACMAFVLDEIYKLLHPMMPFMTEELWAQTAGEGQERPTLLCHAAWPEPDFADPDAAAEINWLIELVSGIRSVRSEMNVPPSAIAPLVLVGANALTHERLSRHDRRDPAAGARRRDQPRRGRAAGVRPVRRRRGDCLPAARHADRPQGRGGAAAEGTRQGDGRNRQAAQQAVERKICRQCSGRRGGRRARKARRVSRGARKTRHRPVEGARRELTRVPARLNSPP